MERSEREKKTDKRQRSLFERQTGGHQGTCTHGAKRTQGKHPTSKRNKLGTDTKQTADKCQTEMECKHGEVMAELQQGKKKTQTYVSTKESFALLYGWLCRASDRNVK